MIEERDMSTSGIFGNEKMEESVKGSFWQQQFAGKRTQPQLIFDLIFGVFGPIACFAFDPVVFQSSFLGPPLFGEQQILVYTLSALEIIVLCVWLIFGGSLRFLNAFIGSFLIWGGIASASIGLILFQYSLFGIMFFGIGLLGFTPFVTAVVYGRNGFRAWNIASGNSPLLLRAGSLFLSLTVALGAPVVISTTIRSYVDKAVSEILKGDSQQARAAVEGLRPLTYLARSELNKLVNAYMAETDPIRKQHLKNCYEQITGESIENRASILLD
jgi:hypothetical protein